MSSIGAIGNRYDITINSPTITSNSAATQRAESLSFQNLAISSTGHPPGCSCPICSGQRSITINTTVAAAKSANFDVLATTGMHGAGCTCPICSGKRAMSIKTNVTTGAAKEANFNALLISRHGKDCNCPICSGQRSLSIKTPDKTINSKNTVSNNLSTELTNAIKAKETPNQENGNSQNNVLIKSDDSLAQNTSISKNNLALAKATSRNNLPTTNNNVSKNIAKDGGSHQITKPADKTVARNISSNHQNNQSIEHTSTNKSLQVSNNTTSSQATSSSSSNATTANITTNATVNTASNVAVNLTANVVTPNVPNINIASSYNTVNNINNATNVATTNLTTNLTTSLTNSGQPIMQNVTSNVGNINLSTLTSALSRAANINIPQNRVFAENIAGKAVLAMSSGDKPVKINMTLLNSQDGRLVLKGKNGQLVLEKDAKLNGGKLVFGENKSKTTKMPNDLPPMISFNALSNALRSKDINKNNLAKLFMLLTGKFMDEDQITDDLEGMFGVWKDHIKKLREEKERREQKRKDDQQNNKKNQDNDDKDDEKQPEIAGVAA